MEPSDFLTVESQASSPLEKRRAVIAQALGLPADALHPVEPRWLRLMQDGVLVALHIRRWRATARLTWEDLGLPGANLPGDAAGVAPLDDLLHLGDKRLLPKPYFDQLNSLESAARKALDRYSFKTYWGAFLPASAYAEWKALNDDYQARYFALRDQIVAGYDAVIADLAAEYRQAGRTAYQRLNLLDPTGMTLQEWKEEQAFVTAFVRRILALIPGREEIAASFAFDVEFRFVPLPSLLAEDLAAKERIDADRQRLRAEQEQARQRDWQAQAEEREQERLAREHERRLAEARAAMERDVLRAAQEQKAALIDGFLRDLVGQLRSLVYEMTTDVLASIDKNGAKLVGKSAEQLRNLIAEVGRLNFFGDQEIDAAMARVQALLAPAPQQRDIGAIQTQLQAIATVARATLLDLGERPRSARLVGVADEPSPALVRSARRTLGLMADDDADMALPAVRQSRGEAVTPAVDSPAIKGL